MVNLAKRAAAALAALAFLTGTASAQVPDPFARDLAQRLAAAETSLSELGYARAAGPFAGGLEEQRTRRFTVTLRAGHDYRIAGVCDYRCADFDLRVFTAENQLIARDVFEDATPIIHIRPIATGRYDIEAAMVRCRQAPCWFAFNVYSR